MNTASNTAANTAANGIARVSVFQNSRAASPEDAEVTEVAEVAEMLRDPAGPLAALKDRVRQANRAELVKIKIHEAPAVAFSGTFRGGRRERDLSDPSGLVVLEAREHGGPVQEKSLSTLGAATALAFDSLGDRETKVVIAVEPHPTNKQEYTEAFRAAREYLEGLPGQNERWEIAGSPEIAHITLLAHDPDTYFPEQDVEPVRWTMREKNQEDQKYNSRLWEAAVRMAHAERIRPVKIQKVAVRASPGIKHLTFKYQEDQGTEELRDKASELYHKVLALGPGEPEEPYTGTTPPQGPED